MATAGPSSTKPVAKPMAKTASGSAKPAAAKTVAGAKAGVAKTGTAAKPAGAKPGAKTAVAAAPVKAPVVAKELDPQMVAVLVGGLFVVVLGGYFLFGQTKAPTRVPPPSLTSGGIRPTGSQQLPLPREGSQQTAFGSGQQPVPGATGAPGSANPANPAPPGALNQRPGVAVGPATGTTVGRSPNSAFNQSQTASPFGQQGGGQPVGVQPASQPVPATVGSAGSVPMQPRVLPQSPGLQPAAPPLSGSLPAAPDQGEGTHNASLVGDVKDKPKSRERGDGTEIIAIGNGSKVTPLEAPAPPPKP